MSCGTYSLVFSSAGAPPSLHTGITWEGADFYEVTMPGPDPDHFKSKAPGSNVQPELRTTELELSTSREAVMIIECLFF